MDKHNAIRMAGGMVGGIAAAAALALGLVISAPHLTAAQDQTQTQTERMRPGGRGPGGPMGPMGRGGRMGGPMGGGALMGIVRDLSDAQRQQVRTIHEKHAEQIRPLAERVRAAREAVNTAIVSGNTGNLQALAIEVGNAETELMFATAQVQAEVYNVLTPEQKQTLAERRKNMEQRRQEMMKRRQGGQ